MPDLFVIPEELVLRDYQSAAIDRAKENRRAGIRAQLLCSPTGSGKTAIAMKLMQRAAEKGSRSAFLVDRSSLVDQTSQALDKYGIEHGILQAQHWRARPDAHIQLVSAQTLGRRLGNGGYLDRALYGLKFVIVDEAHVNYEATNRWIASLPESVSVIALSATPFTRGLANHYGAVINVASTNTLAAEGHLVMPLIYSAQEIDLTGIPIRGGEWADEGLEKAGVKIIGNVVAEYQRRTLEHFGGPAKAIYFSATVAHGAEICAAFAAVGLNFQLISYRDDEDERKAKIEEFRKPNSAIVGLVSVDALSRGFDVPDVLVCGLCRPLRKSLSTHVQMVGRIMRPAPGKTKAIVIDHSGNALRFLQDTADFWENGVSELSSASEKDSKVRETPKPKERQDAVCKCSAVIPVGSQFCLACGAERPRRSSGIAQVAGETKLLTMDPRNVKSGRGFDYAKHPILRDRTFAYRSILACTTQWKRGDILAARRSAAGLYKGAYGEWPRGMDHLEPFPELTDEVRRFCVDEARRFARKQKKQEATRAAA